VTERWFSVTLIKIPPRNTEWIMLKSSLCVHLFVIHGHWICYFQFNNCDYSLRNRRQKTKYRFSCTYGFLKILVLHIGFAILNCTFFTTDLKSMTIKHCTPCSRIWMVIFLTRRDFGHCRWRASRWRIKFNNIISEQMIDSF